MESDRRMTEEYALEILKTFSRLTQDEVEDMNQTMRQLIQEKQNLAC